MPRSPLAALVLTGALLTTSCGSSDDGTADPAPSASPATSSPASAPASSAAPDPEPTDTGPTDTGPTAASGDTYAGLAPATGPLVTSVVSELNAPADWTGESRSDTLGAAITGPDRFSSIETSEDPTIGPPRDVAELVATARKLGSYQEGGVTRFDNVQIVGSPAYHLGGVDRIFDSYVDEFGFVAAGHDVTVRVSTPPDLAPAERERLVGSIMASYRLK